MKDTGPTGGTGPASVQQLVDTAVATTNSAYEVRVTVTTDTNAMSISATDRNLNLIVL